MLNAATHIALLYVGATKYHSSQESDPLGSLRGGRPQRGLNMGDDPFEGGGGPAERVGGAIPSVGEGDNRVGKRVEVGEVGVAEALAAQDGKPLLDLVHPRAVNGEEVEHE